MVTNESATVLHVGPRDGGVYGALTAVTGEAEDIVLSTAETREKALATLADEEVACLVDGFVAGEERMDFLSAVRERKGDLPYLFVADDPVLADEALAAGVTDVVVRHDAVSDEALLERRLDALLTQQNSKRQHPGKQEATGELLDAINDIFYVLDTDGFLTRWNETARQVTGYTDEELSGMRGREFFPEEDRDRAADAMQEVLDTGSATVEAEMVTKDGERVPVEYTATKLVDDDGRARGVVGVGRDITERKERERRLRREHDRLSATLDAAPYPFAHVRFDDGDPIVQQLNNAFEEVFGYEEQLLCGKPLDEFIVPQEAETREVNELASQGEAIEREVVRQTADGERRDFLFKARPLVREDGTVEGLGAYVDITERKEREEELVYRRALLEAQAENTVDGLLLADEDGTVHYYNERFLEMWDIPRSVVANQSDDEILSAVHDLHADPEAFRERVAELYDDPEAKSREAIELTDGRWFERYSAPVRGDDGTYYGRLWVFRDITERKERERELRLKKRAMDEAPVGITIHDVDGSDREITYVNDGFIQVAGYGREETIGRDISVLFGAETSEAERDLLVRALNRGESITRVLLLYRKDDQPFWGRISLAPVTNETGEVTRFISFLQDVTKAKEHEQEIERRLNEFGEVLAEELSTPIGDARETIQTALERDDMAEVEVADRSLERVEKLIDDLTTVHSFSVKSREVSETARDGFGTTR